MKFVLLNIDLFVWFDGCLFSSSFFVIIKETLNLVH